MACYQKLIKDSIWYTYIITNNCSQSLLPIGFSDVLELSYINKNLVTKAKILHNQNYPKEIDQPNDPAVPDTKFTIK